MKILVLQGPNLNLLGKREPDIYGMKGNEDLMSSLKAKFKETEFEYFQSNLEGEIIDALQRSTIRGIEGVILNAGGYTHTSVAIADAIAAIKTPVVEVHISNIYARESYRHKSLLAAYCKGSISGFGLKGYHLAVHALLD